MLTDKPKRILLAIEYLGPTADHCELYQPPVYTVVNQSPSGRGVAFTADNNILIFNMLQNIFKVRRRPV